MMRAPLLRSIVVVVVVVATSSLALAARTRIAPPRVRQVAPSFALRAQSGTRVDLAAAAGSKAVILFYRGYW